MLVTARKKGYPGPFQEYKLIELPRPNCRRAVGRKVASIGRPRPKSALRKKSNRKIHNQQKPSGSRKRLSIKNPIGMADFGNDIGRFDRLEIALRRPDRSAPSPACNTPVGTWIIIPLRIATFLANATAERFTGPV